MGSKTKGCKSCMAMGRSIKMCFAASACAVCHYEWALRERETSPEMPECGQKFRLMVVGHLEPDEWETVG